MAKRYHNTNPHRRHSEVVNSFQWETDDLFSGLIARMGGRPFLGFVSIILFLLLLSFACEKAMGGVEGSASVSSIATHQDADSASLIDQRSARTAAAPQAGAERGSLFFELFPGNLTQKLVLIAYDRVSKSVSGGASVVTPATQQDAESGSMNVNPGAQAATSPQTGIDGGSNFFDTFLEGAPPNGGDMTWRDSASMLAFRLTIAAVLGAVVAFRPRRFSPSRHRNPYVVQTQILLSIVACALMMIVGDSAARAFGIFAAASLVRFRTNIRDPKEITILLVTLGVGLAAGVGRWELATMFTLFVLVVLEILENYEHQQAVRLMELSVKTHNVESTDDAVRELFKRNNLEVDIKELNKQSEKHPLGKVVYSVDLNRKVDTERLAAEIYLADPVNIDRVEWHRQKAPSFANGA